MRPAGGWSGLLSSELLEPCSTGGTGGIMSEIKLKSWRSLLKLIALDIRYLMLSSQDGVVLIYKPSSIHADSLPGSVVLLENLKLAQTFQHQNSRISATSIYPQPFVQLVDSTLRGT
ncbi:hypothetical protein RRG08_048575 [Elysia crispata]|uniref:Uncharacterized protein n=1 Tax=Elysia crispata TaxID=231223 RepID=A0AAE1B597_9GAST|nr:hypothetical protein RRG08_048575 [Elysia crispata]